jgi:hypothetical protein
MDVYRLLRIFKYASRMNYHHDVPTSPEHIWFQMRSMRVQLLVRSGDRLVNQLMNRLLTKVPPRPAAPTEIQIELG